MNNYTPGEISGARSAVAKMQNDLGKEVIENAKILDDVIARLVEAQSKFKTTSKDYKNIGKQMEAINVLKKQALDLAEDEKAEVVDLIEKNKDLKDIRVNTEVEINKYLVKNLQDRTKLTKAEKQELANLQTKGITLKANQTMELKGNKKVADEQTKNVKVASANMLKAVSSGLSSAASKVNEILNTINLDKLANGGKELSETWKVMNSTMTAFKLDRKEFQLYKNDVIDSLQDVGGAGDFKSMFNAKDITKYMDQMVTMGVKDTETAKEMVTTIAFGNKFLGQSAETQESLYKLQKRNNVEGLIESQTATTAKILTSQLNVSKEQLELYQQQAIANADTLSLLGLEGDKLTEYMNDQKETQAKLADAYGDTAAQGADSAIKLLASGDFKGASMFGDQYKEYLDGLTSGTMKMSDIVDKLASGGAKDSLAGNYIDMVKRGASSEELMAYGDVMKQNGADDKLLMFLQSISKDNGAAYKASDKKYEDSTQEYKEMSDKDIIDSVAKKFQDTMSDKDLMINAMATEFLKIDWQTLQTIASWGSIIIVGLNAVSSILKVVSWFKGGKWFDKLLKGGKSLGTKILSGLKSLGKTVVNGVKGAFKGIKGAFKGAGDFIGKVAGSGTKLGGELGIGGGKGAAKGLSKQLLGNGSLATAAGVAGAAWTVIDGFKGATKMADKLYADDKGKVSAGNRVKGALIGAVSGSKVNDSKNGYEGLTGKAMKKLGMSSDTAASVKNIGGGAASGAAKGALIGSAIPVIGTAAGAIVGGVAGLIGGIFKDKDRKKKEEEERKKAEEQARKEAERQRKEADTLRAIQVATEETADNTSIGGTYRNVFFDSNKLSSGGLTGMGGPTTSANEVTGPAGGMYQGVDISPFTKTSDYISKEDVANGKGRVVKKDGKIISQGAHSGIDFGAPAGTPIGAAAAGTVAFAGWKNNGGGNQTWITGYDGLTYMYLHQRETPPVQAGQKVEQGDTIGYVGTTGNSNGNHLHFSVKRNGSYINPAPYVNTSIFTAKPGGHSFGGGKSVSSGAKSKPTVGRGITTLSKVYDANTMYSMGGPYDDSNVVAGLNKINQTLIDLSARQDEQQKVIDALSVKPIGKLSY